MHSKSDCRLPRRVAADMFIVVTAAAVGWTGRVEGWGGGKSVKWRVLAGWGGVGVLPDTGVSLKAPIRCGRVKQMGDFGTRGGPLASAAAVSLPSQPTFTRQPFFLKLSQSPVTASFNATICVPHPPNPTHLNRPNGETFQRGYDAQQTPRRNG